CTRSVPVMPLRLPPPVLTHRTFTTVPGLRSVRERLGPGRTELMERHELEQWLCGPDSTPPSPAAIAEALGLPFDALADTTLLRTLARVRSLRFTLAVLH